MEASPRGRSSASDARMGRRANLDGARAGDGRVFGFDLVGSRGPVVAITDERAVRLALALRADLREDRDFRVPNGRRLSAVDVENAAALLHDVNGRGAPARSRGLDGLET